MWDRFPPRMRKAMTTALELAGREGAAEATEEHLLRALVNDPACAAAFMFEQAGIAPQSILDGLAHLDESVSGNARALSPARSTFAGSIRLAPADPLPWPFRLPEPESPSVFTPIVLEPVEWRDPEGKLVFGWRLSE